MGSITLISNAFSHLTLVLSNSFFNMRLITDPPHNPVLKGTKSVTQPGQQWPTLHHPSSERGSMESLRHPWGASFMGDYCKIATAIIPSAQIPACRHSSHPGPDFNRLVPISTCRAYHQAFPWCLNRSKHECLPYLSSAVWTSTEKAFNSIWLKWPTVLTMWL